MIEKETTLKKLEHFSLFKIILISLSVSAFLLTFVSLIMTISPPILFPYKPFDAGHSFSLFMKMLYMFILFNCIVSLLGALIKKIKWQWVFIWFFTANFLDIGKDTALLLTSKFSEIFNYTSVTLYALAVLMICLYLIKRWFSDKPNLTLTRKKEKSFKKLFIYGAFVFIVFWLIVLLSIHGSQNVKFTISQTASVLLAITLPFSATTFVQTIIQDKSRKAFIIFTALSILFLVLAALLSVPIDSPYDMY